MMAVIGWLIVTGFSAFFGIGGILLFFVGNAFSGRLCYEALIPVAIGAALLYASYTHFPFVLSLVQ